ncbi:AAA family ATPase [Methanosarcina sp. KYL-1]|nr:AAA family ATPase [Methanosarcina sp. KYL-1]
MKDIHPFFLITFLAYKEIDLPIENLKDTHGIERTFLEKYYRPTEEYDGYFRPGRTSDKSKMWVSAKYPDAGLQSVRTRNRIIIDALKHDTGGGYGWNKDYVIKLKPLLKDDIRLPVYYMAVWIYRKKDWPDSTTTQDVIKEFKTQFNITKEEEEILFEMSIPDELDKNNLFCSEPLDWTELKKIIGNYPRAPLEEGGFLKSLSLTGVGPTHHLEFEPGERLNIIAGDNGLGKTFLLDCAWWALSGNWANKPIHPQLGARWSNASIQFDIGSSDISEKIKSEYDWERARWITDVKRRILPGLLIYARIDNSFAICDPAKITLYESIWQSGAQLSLDKYAISVDPMDFPQGHLKLSEKEVWNGKQYQKPYGIEGVLCNGLIRDWMTWSANKESEAFDLLKSALKSLSPTGSKPMTPGKPIRLPTDAREIPTIKHPYGDVPIVDVSAGVRRILSLAYLITWAWIEHKTTSHQIKKKPQKKMILLIDEMESHLHPQWQRTIIPALIDVVKILSPDLEVQFMIATHSPLVMASSEPFFDRDVDKLFHLDLLGDEVELKEISFIRYGKIDNWLQSEIFGLRHARSQEADEAIEKAKKIQLNPNPETKDVKIINDELQKYLSGTDEFWPRWKYFAEKYGVK